MFHDYVFNNGRKIDFGRAQFLMDKGLLKQAILDMEAERDDPDRHRWDATYGNQWIFEQYCQLHRKKYGEAFIVIADPNWT